MKIKEKRGRKGGERIRGTVIKYKSEKHLRKNKGNKVLEKRGKKMDEKWTRIKITWIKNA